MQNHEARDELVTRHAIFQILDRDIIPCDCGAYRKIMQNKEPDLLMTQCSKCNTQEPFNIANLTLIGGALLLYAIGKVGEVKIKTPMVTNEDLCKMIEDAQDNDETWEKEFRSYTLRKKLHILNGSQSQ